MSGHRTDAERRREVEGWRASGEGVERYAARRGFSATTLRKWIARTGTTASGLTSAPALVRVVAASAAAPAEVVVEIGAARIRVAGTFDAELLRSVVSALSERGT
jgi:transposase-like protein